MCFPEINSSHLPHSYPFLESTKIPVNFIQNPSKSFNMQFTASLIALSTMAAFASAAQIMFCSDISCGAAGGSCTYQSPSDPSGCIELGGIYSAKTISLGSNEKCKFLFF